MHYHEIIRERVLLFDLRDKVTVLENPSAKQIAAMFDKQDHFRGLWNPIEDDLWFWESDKAVHFQIAALVGVPFKQTGQLVLGKQQDGRIGVLADHLHKNAMLSSPNLIKSLSKLDWFAG